MGGYFLQAAAAQNVATNTGNTGIWGGTSYGTTTTISYPVTINGDWTIGYQQPAKRKFIEELRDEINKWHGDLN